MSNKLKITNIIEDSFQEYENEWSLVIFFAGCNLSCPECYNLISMYDVKWTLENEDEYKQFLDKNISPKHTAVVLLGGEPTIHGDNLIRFCEFIKVNYDLKIKLYTNALEVPVWEELLRKKLIDAVSIDVKCVKGDTKKILGKEINPEVYKSIINKMILELILFHGFDDSNIEFRTTKWDCVIDQLPDIKKFVNNLITCDLYNMPKIKHIIQDKFTP